MRRYSKLLEIIFVIFISVLPFSNRELPMFGVTLKSDLILFFIYILFGIGFIFMRNYRKEFLNFISQGIKRYFIIGMVFLVILMFYSTSYSEFKMVSLRESIRFVTYGILILLVAFEFGKDKVFIRVFKYLKIVATVQCVLGIVQFVTGFMILPEFGTEAYKWNRIHGSFENPNAFAAFLVIILFPVFMLEIKRVKQMKLSSLYFPVLVTINLMLCLSRNGVIGIAVGLVIMTLLYSKKVFTYIIGPLTIMSGFVVFNRSIVNKIFSDTRIPLWKCAIKMIKDNPVKGVGNGCYKEVYNVYRAKYPQFRVHSFLNMPPHNSYLKILSELGALALVCFGVILGDYFRMINHIIKNEMNEEIKNVTLGILCSTVAFLVMNLVDDLFFIPKLTTFFWIFAALVFGIKQRRSY